MDHGTEKVLHELGVLGITWDAAQKLLNEAFADSTRVHAMGARGLALIPGTDKAVVYDTGIDGMDFRYFIEDAPDVHVDWHMTPAEWEELRSTLVGQALAHGQAKPYLFRLYQEGKLGSISPRPHIVQRANVNSSLWTCSCGPRFTSLRGQHEHVVCPLSPGYPHNGR